VGSQVEIFGKKYPRALVLVVGITFPLLVLALLLATFPHLLILLTTDFGPDLPEDNELKELLDREYQVFEELRALVAQYEGHVRVYDSGWGLDGITKEKADAIRASLSRVGALGIEKREDRNGMLEVGFRMAGLHGGPWGTSKWIEYRQAAPSPIVEETDPPEPQERGTARFVPLDREGWYIVRRW
jgi:hypothetical protein